MKSEDATPACYDSAHSVRSEMQTAFSEVQPTPWNLVYKDWPEESHRSWQAEPEMHQGGFPSRLDRSAADVREIGMALDSLATGIRKRFIFSLRLSRLEARVEKLEKAEKSRSVSVPINTFAPEPYEMLGRIEVLLEPMGDEFMATFLDANISAGGVTDVDALANLKSAILDVFDSLENTDPNRLGPEPRSQLAVLRGLLRRMAAEE